MPGLLVSVRSAAEAHSAIAGGVTVLDVKEPDRGSLGRADLEIWAAVARLAPPAVPVSVALGELREWDRQPAPRPEAWLGITYRKMGLAGSGQGGVAAWLDLRRSWGPGPRWVAVAYSDWQRAESPDPDAILDMAISAPDCAGVLVDTWSKAHRGELDRSWADWAARAREGGKFVALAGGLDEDDFERLAPLKPHVFAVRGAACHQGRRKATIDPDRVARLVRAARKSGNHPPAVPQGQWD